VNPADETLSSLNSLKIDDVALCSLDLSKNISLKKCFSQIKNLAVDNLFCNASTLANGQDFILMVSQNLTTFNLTINQRRRMTFERITSFKLGQFPNLRHLAVQLKAFAHYNVNGLNSLNRLLYVSSSRSDIETLEITITWQKVCQKKAKDLFSPHSGWHTLDEILTCEKIVSLRKVRLCLDLEIVSMKFDINWQTTRDAILPCINDLFPKCRALTNRILDTNVKVRRGTPW